MKRRRFQLCQQKPFSEELGPMVLEYRTFAIAVSSVIEYETTMSIAQKNDLCTPEIIQSVMFG